MNSCAQRPNKMNLKTQIDINMFYEQWYFPLYPWNSIKHISCCYLANFGINLFAEKKSHSQSTLNGQYFTLQLKNWWCSTFKIVLKRGCLQFVCSITIYLVLSKWKKIQWKITINFSKRTWPFFWFLMSHLRNSACTFH